MKHAAAHTFLSFIKKEFFHIFRDVRTMLIIVGIPVTQILIIGFAVSTEVKQVPTAVYDPLKDASTRAVIEQLRASELFDVRTMLEHPDEIDRVFERGEASLVVVFGEASVQLVVDATDPNQGTTTAEYASNIIHTAGASPLQIVPEVEMLYNPELRSSYNFVPGLMGLIFMIICAMMTSIAIVREKETGTMEVLLASPVKPAHIVVSKMIPYFLISWVIFVLILLLSVFVLNVPVSGNLVWLNVLTLLFILVALSLGLLISTLVKTQVAAMLVSSMGLMMPVMILSGFIFPIESIPAALQAISAVIPARWYIAGAKKLMIEGVPVYRVAKEMLVLAGMATGIILISLRNFKTRLE
ncbi:MAG: ABC transporter permease [Dysgonamonadaceae bacterium]|jgi:ABC-2 type transport system permease protein|nr:ABC transporter permease [Dysgonamonadaceae bacterium]